VIKERNMKEYNGDTIAYKWEFEKKNLRDGGRKTLLSAILTKI